MASSSIQPFDCNRHGPKTGAVPLLGGSWDPSNTTSPGPKFTSVPSGLLVHPAVWPQRTWAENWGLYPFRGGGAGSSSNTMSPRLRLYLRTKWHLILIYPAVGLNRHGPKLCGCALLGRGAGSPSNTMLPGPRPNCTPSGTLTHRAVWPQ